MTYADELKGLRNYIYLYHNMERRKDHYNNWNFTDSMDWDGNGTYSMWYNLNTTLLAMSEKYIIGNETINKISLSL